MIEGMIKEKEEKVNELFDLNWDEFKDKSFPEKQKLMDKWLGEWEEKDLAEWFNVGEDVIDEEVGRLGLDSGEEIFKKVQKEKSGRNGRKKVERDLVLDNEKMEKYKNEELINWKDFRRLSKDQAKEIANVYLDRYGRKAKLSEALGVAKETLRKELRNLGIDRKEDRGIERKDRNVRLEEEELDKYKSNEFMGWKLFRVLVEDQAKEIAREYLKNRTQASLAKDFGVSADTLTKQLNSLGATRKMFGYTDDLRDFSEMGEKGKDKKGKKASKKGLYISPADVESYKSGERKLTWKRLKRMRDDIAKDLMIHYLRNNSKRELAVYWDVTYETIRNRMKKLEITREDIRGEEDKQEEVEGVNEGFDRGKQVEDEVVDEQEVVEDDGEELEDVEEEEEEEDEEGKGEEVVNEVVNEEEREVYVVDNGKKDLDTVIDVREVKRSGEILEYLRRMGEFLEVVGDEVYIDISVKKKKEGKGA